MAGSKRWFAYTADDGSIFGIQLDESNTEAVNGTAGALPTGLTYSIPRNLKVREVFYGNSLRTIRVVVLTPAIYTAVQTNTPNIGDPITPADDLLYLRKNGERIRGIRRIDTGIDDGDTPT